MRIGENVELKEKLVFWNFTGKLYIRMFSWVGIVSHAFMPVEETKNLIIVTMSERQDKPAQF